MTATAPVPLRAGVRALHRRRTRAVRATTMSAPASRCARSASLSRRSIGTAAAPASRQACSAITKSAPGGSAIATRLRALRCAPARSERWPSTARRRSGCARAPRSRPGPGAWPRRREVQDATTDTVVSRRRANDVADRRRVPGHPLRDGPRRTRRRDREDHDQPPRGPQRVPPGDRDRAVRRVHPRPRGPRRRRRDPDRRGPGRVLLGRRPARARLSAAAT